MIRCVRVFIIGAALAAAFLQGPCPPSARGDDVGDELLEMVVELLASPDRDMRGLAFQQVREELPGEEATKRFVEELPKLTVENQAGLLEALGERGDRTARPAVVKMVEAEAIPVRAAAVAALAKLGGSDDVSLLAGQIGAEAAAVRAAARQSLTTLQGDAVNQAVLSVFEEAEAELQMALLNVLARRNAREAVPAVLEAARANDADVRVAAIRALRQLADEEHAGDLVEAVKAAGDDGERYQAKLALMALAARNRERCAQAILAGLAEADPPATAALLEALARAGGEAALGAVAARLDDANDSVRDAAVRTLAIWSDPAAVEHLARVADTTDDMRHHVVAVRGLAQIAQPRPDRPADVETLGKAFELARRSDEKRLVLGYAGASGDPAALRIILPAMDDPAIVEAAALAVVIIAEQFEEEVATIREALRRVIDASKDNALRARAQKVLEGQ